MNDGAPQSAGDARQAWLRTLGIDITPRRGAAGGAAANAAVPPATSTDLFFAKDSDSLTESDQQSLAAYAKAYSEAKSAQRITVEGFASEEGEKAHNQDLSAKRAKAVAEYLIGQGIPKDRVTAAGRGATAAFSESDLGQNRRARIAPPPPTAAAASAATAAGKTPAARDPSMPHDLGMRPKGGLPRLDQDAAERIAGTDTDVPRDQVERTLKDFLEKLAEGQKAKTLKATGRAQVAEFTLRSGLPGQPYVNNSDDRDYPPDDLAAKIAANLPDRIPAANFAAFLKLRPVEEKKPGSVTDQLHSKYVEERDKLVNKLPKSIQGAARKAIDAAVEKGISFAADQVLQGVSADLKDEAQKFVDDYAKKITGSGDGSN